MIKCQIPNCENNSLMKFHGKWCCGDCIMKIEKQKEDNFWRNVNGNEKNTGN